MLQTLGSMARSVLVAVRALGCLIALTIVAAIILGPPVLTEFSKTLVLSCLLI
jgi:hypothetical protein